MVGGTTDIAAASDTGELFGNYEAIKHAEANGETLTREDIEVTVEQVTVVLKRGKIVDARRTKGHRTRCIAAGERGYQFHRDHRPTRWREGSPSPAPH